MTAPAETLAVPAAPVEIEAPATAVEAAASAAELESHVRVAEASGRLGAEAALGLVSRARRVRALVVGLRRSVKRKRAD